ncbi:MAG: hypothetical protein U1F42_06955 [Candidatus Competibacteraceae bacterium]
MTGIALNSVPNSKKLALSTIKISTPGKDCTTTSTEYRDEHGRYVPEAEAREKQARIWVWKEGERSFLCHRKVIIKQAEKVPKMIKIIIRNNYYRFYKPLHPASLSETRTV